MAEEEKKKELIDAFKSYDWIILRTDPINGKIYLHSTTVPSYIEKKVDEYKEEDFNRYHIENKIKAPYILSSIYIDWLLMHLVQTGIPLYKVGNKEISCVADIKRLWDDAGLSNSTVLEWKEYYRVMAYLQPQNLRIEKELMPKLDIEKKSETTGKKIPRGQKQAYVDPNILNEFLIGIIKEYPSLSHGQIAKKARERMKTDGKFQGVLYKERTLKNKICELKKTTNYTKPSFSKLKNDGKMTGKKRHLKSDVKT